MFHRRATILEWAAKTVAIVVVDATGFKKSVDPVRLFVFVSNCRTCLREVGKGKFLHPPPPQCCLNKAIVLYSATQRITANITS